MLEHRLAQSEDLGSKTENQILFDTFNDLKSQIRTLENELKKIRPDIDQKMATGELVGYPDAYLSLQQAVKYEVDMDALVGDVGEKVALRVCDVSSTKVKKLIELGLIKEDAPYISKSVTSSLVTKTQSK